MRSRVRSSSRPGELTALDFRHVASTYGGQCAMQRQMLEMRGPTRGGPAGYSKISSGKSAETIQFGTSTTSLIRRSAATLATT